MTYGQARPSRGAKTNFSGVRNGAQNRGNYSYAKHTPRASMSRDYNYRELERREHERRAAYARRLEEIKRYEKQVKEERKRARRSAKIREKNEQIARDRELKRREIKVIRDKLPLSFVAMVAAATVMIMAVVFSFSQISETTAERSEIQSKIDALDAEKEQLSHDLTLKNDISVIEQKATKELMMVRESSLDKKYISLAAEDKVVLENNDKSSDDKAAGSALSAFSAIFGDIMDYIK